MLEQFAWARQGLAAAVAIGTLCSLLSVPVVLKRMAFIGQGVSHAGFGGVGLAIFLGLGVGARLDAVVLAFCVGAALLIGVLSRRRAVEPDTAIGVLLAAAMALGVLLTDLSQHLRTVAWYRQWIGPGTQTIGFHEVLFGGLWQITRTQMWLAVTLSLAVIVLLAGLFKEMVFFTFDEAAARVFGVPTRWLYYLLLVVLSLTIVMSIRLVGIILASALLVIPGATATLLSERLSRVLLAAVGVGLSGTVGGLLLSLELGYLSSGPCIVAVLSVCFALAFGWRTIADRGKMVVD